jgi:hypothetical protein
MAVVGVASVASLSIAAAPAAFASGPGGSDIVKTFLKPVAGYTGTTCLHSLFGIPDGTLVSQTSTCGVTITYTPTPTKYSVPASWGNWGTPPNTESATPDVLWTGTSDVLTLSYSKAVSISGVEMEPNLFTTENMQASWYRGDGVLLGTQARDVTSPAGTRLFAAKVSPKAKKLVLTNSATAGGPGWGFGVAQVRTK